MILFRKPFAAADREVVPALKAAPGPTLPQAQAEAATKARANPNAPLPLCTPVELDRYVDGQRVQRRGYVKACRLIVPPRYDVALDSGDQVYDVAASELRLVVPEGRVA